MLRFFRRLLYLVFLLLGACTHSDSVTAPAQAQDSFGIRASSNPLAVSSDKYLVSIKKTSLEKEFLFQTDMIWDSPSPRFEGLKSRIVAFRKRAKSLFLIEASSGYVITQELPQTRIMAEFPIITESADTIVFDFNRGISEVRIATDWRDGDVDESARTQDADVAPIPLKYSHIESAFFGAQNNLVIIQRAVAVSRDPKKETMPIELHYYISPYFKNPKYSPAPNIHPGFGYFETIPLARLRGGFDSYATRIDPDSAKKFVYAISANTPTEFREAIREGVLYWNSAFGFEKIQVIDAPANVSAPNPDYNLIQWVSDDVAETSAADAQIDPRTGEILHSQIYLTSAFVFFARNEAYGLARKKAALHSEFSVAGMAPARLCNQAASPDANLSPRSGLYAGRLGLIKFNNDTALEISRDYIRVAVAHEVGHTLGLRHNFAGNLASNVTVDKIYELMDVYVKELTVPPTVRFTSSVMDYGRLQTDLLVGRQIHQGGGALLYDRAAIRELYFAEKPTSREKTPFCTDQHVGDYFGCLSFDQGPSLLQSAYYETQRALAEAPERLIELIVNQKTNPLLTHNKSPGEIVLNPTTEAEKILAPRALFLKALSRRALDIRVANDLGPLTALNRDKMRSLSRKNLSDEFSALGGISVALAPLPKSLAGVWQSKFNSLIDSDVFRSNLGANGLPFVFSEQDISRAKELALLFFTRLEQDLFAVDIKQLRLELYTISDSKEADDFAGVLRDRAEEYILRTVEDSTALVHTTIGLLNKTKHSIALPNYFYKNDLRAAAAMLFQDRRVEGTDWAVREKRELLAAFDAHVSSVLGKKIKLEDIDAANSPRAVVRWALDVQQLKSAIEELGDAPEDKSDDVGLLNDDGED